MNYLTAYLPLLSAIFIFSSGFFVFLRRRTFLSFLLLMFCLSFTIWLFSAFMMLKSFSEGRDARAIFWDRVVYMGVVFMPTLILHLSIAFIRTIKQKKLLSTGYIISFIFLIFTRSDYFVKDLYKYKWGCHTVAQPLHHVFLLFFWGYVSLAVVNFYKYYKKTESGSEKNRTKYLLLAVFLLFSIGGLGYLPAYKIPIYPFPFLSGVIFTIILAYAILRYRLLDIKLAITRTGVFVSVYTFVLGIPFALAVGLRPWLSAMIGLNWWMVPLGAMMALATIGPFIYIYLERRAEDRLFKEQKRYQNTLKQASLGMTRIRDLQKLLKLIVYMMTKSVRLNYASIYLLDKENNFFRMEAVRDVNKNRSKTILPQIGISSPLTRFLSIEREPLVLEEVGRRLQDNSSLSLLDEVRKQMFSLGASVIVPSFVEDKLLGFMVLGDKRSGDIYTEDDLRVFTVLANQAALAIENARFFEEAKEMQDQISQAEKMATIGTMADGLSHQINNRFHALSLIAGDTMDTIKFTDVNNYTEEQKDLIAQISHALERIQANVIQGGEIVKGMLKYTRKGEEGLASVTLNSIVDSALEMVQFKIRLSEIDIIKDYPKDTPPVHGNLAQLQEVFFNLIDNAYYAMMERREALKEEGYRGKIRIHTESLRSGYLSISIEDNGIGVKQENIKKMFTPFFTTKASSRKGTGLGLYVIKKIITGHNGKISIESTYGQGTKFIIDLPLAREHVEGRKVKS